jgi:tetratricopeptide (TPR) repeat protein
VIDDGAPAWTRHPRFALLACLALAAVVVLLYGQTLSYGYVGLDDEVIIQQDHEFLGDLANLPRAFQRGVFGATYTEGGNFYRPLLIVSLMLDAQVGGTDLTAFRVTNVLLHAVATCLVLHLLLALGTRREIALLLATVFAVHPLNVQAVAWVSGRNDSLLAVFALGCLLALIRLQKTGSRRAFGLHLLLFALAVFTKESALALLVVQPLLIGPVLGGDLRAPRSRALGAAWLAVIAVWFWLRSVALPPGATPIHVAGLVSNLPVLLQYLGKVLLPFNLAALPTVRDTGYVYGALATAIAALAIATSQGGSRRRMAFGGAWFLAFLLPSLMVGALAWFEHRMVLPLVGFLIAAAETDLVRRANARSWQAVAAALVVVVGCFGISFARCAAFRDFDAFWTGAVASSPHSSEAHQKYASGLVMRGRFEEAVGLLTAFLERDDSARRIHYHLALAHAGRNGWAEAERHLEAELEIDPGHVEARYLLGVVYARSGRAGQAVAQWERILESHPREVRVYRALLAHHTSRGEVDAAGAIAERMRRLGL